MSNSFYTKLAIKSIASTNQTTNLSVYESKPSGFKIHVSWSGGTGSNIHAFTGTTFTINGIAASNFNGYGTGYYVLSLDKTANNWVIEEDGTEVASCMYTTPGTVTALNPITFTTKVSDNYGMYSAGQFTIPRSGLYQIQFVITPNGAGNFKLYKSSTLYKFGVYSTISDVLGGFIENFTKGDVISIRHDYAIGTYVTGRWISITEIRSQSSSELVVINGTTSNVARLSTKDLGTGSKTTNLSNYEANGSNELPTGSVIKVSWAGGNGVSVHNWTGTGYTIGGLSASVWEGKGTGSITIELDKTNGDWKIIDSPGAIFDILTITTGKCIRYINGYMELTKHLSSNTSTNSTWTFEVPFVASYVPECYGSNNSNKIANAIILFDTPSNSSVQWEYWSCHTNARYGVVSNVSLNAKGMWR